jgi:hypothetical protein
MSAAMRARAANVVWLLAVVAGTVIRLDQLRDQVLVDDEWHALHMLLAHGPRDVLLSFGTTDHSIPLTLWDILLERTVGLTELGMRLPSLVCGLATLVAIPALVRPLVGARVAATLAWLLAIAPLHVFFSRLARPYEPAMLLSFVAAVGLLRTTEERAPRGLRATALVAAVLAPWLLPVVLPTVATALALAALAALARRRDAVRFAQATRARTRRNALLGVAAVVAGWLVLLGAPLLADVGALADKVGRGTIERATLDGASELLLGTTSGALRAVGAAAALAGALVVVRRAPRLALWIAAVVTAQIGALVISAPHGLRFAIVLARYAFVASPFLLLAIAAGVDAAGGALATFARRPMLAPVPAAVLVAMLVACGPLPWIHASPNDFTNHASYQADYEPGRYFERFRPDGVSAFYETLARRPPGSVTVLEAPWYFYWHDLAWLQRVHRQHVVVGFVDERTDAARVGEVPRARAGIRLRNALHVGDADALRARGVDYVILHHDAYREMRVPFADAPVDVARWVAACRRTFGDPVFEDDAITVFAVRPG